MSETSRRGADGGAGERARREGGGRSAPRVALYLDQNYLSGIVKRKAAFVDLEPVLREAVRAGVVSVAESEGHRLESAPRPDLGLLDFLRELSAGRRLPSVPGRREREIRRRLAAVLADEYPQRRPRDSDSLDLDTLAIVLPRCRFVTCDAHMATVCRRTGLDSLYGCELFSGRRHDVERLTERLAGLVATAREPDD